MLTAEGAVQDEMEAFTVAKEIQSAFSKALGDLAALSKAFKAQTPASKSKEQTDAEKETMVRPCPPSLPVPARGSSDCQRSAAGTAELVLVVMLSPVVSAASRLLIAEHAGFVFKSWLLFNCAMIGSNGRDVVDQQGLSWHGSLLQPCPMSCARRETMQSLPCKQPPEGSDPAPTSAPAPAQLLTTASGARQAKATARAQKAVKDSPLNLPQVDQPLASSNGKPAAQRSGATRTADLDRPSSAAASTRLPQREQHCCNVGMYPQDSMQPLQAAGRSTLENAKSLLHSQVVCSSDSSWHECQKSYVCQLCVSSHHSCCIAA